MNRYVAWLGVLIVIALSAGCRQESAAPSEGADATSAAPGAATTAPAEDPPTSALVAVEELFKEAKQLLAQGKTNAVMQLLEESYEAPEFAETRPQIYEAITIIMLMEGRIEEVKTRLARDYKAIPTVSEPCLGIVRNHYLGQYDRDSAHAWVEHLLTLGLEDRMEARLRVWQCEEYLHREDFDRVVALVGTALKELPGETAPDVVEQVLGLAIKAEQVEMAERVLDLLEAVPDGTPRLVELAAVNRAVLDTGRGDMTKAIDRLAGILDSGTISATHHVFSVILKAAREKGDRAACDNLCMVILGDQNAPDSIRRDAVAAYCKAAAEEEYHGEYPARITKLLEVGAPPSMIRESFVRDFPAVTQAAGGDVVQAMIGAAERLAALEDNVEAKDQYMGLALDGYVTLDDYRKAVAMVDAGFREDNQQWQTVMVPKLRAHLAMEEGRTEEAIQYFREFMRVAATWETTPRNSTLQKTLGMNAARIGDLWLKIGETGKAKEAYIEARTYYTESLKGAGDSSDDRAHIEEQLDQIAERLAGMQ